MTDTQPIRIAWGSPYKAPSVLVGEHLITEATRVTVDCPQGEPPKVFLEFGADAVEDLTLEGVVHVVKEEVADPLKIVDSFLENIDPSELDRAVLESMEMGDGAQGYGEGALAVLRRWARGD